jgi:predicted SPOUT superfamily RNA methylase MTH1
MTPKQAAFVREYLIDRNATQAAIRAGYSAETAKQQGSRLLTNVDVQQAVAAKEERLQKKADVTIETIAQELEDARKKAADLGQPAAMVSASMGKAKLYGLLVDKVESENTNINYVVSSEPEEADSQVWVQKYGSSGARSPAPKQH